MILFNYFCIVFLCCILTVYAKRDTLIPFQLVRPTSDHQNLEIVEEGLHVLGNITSPVAVIGVVGPYHTGKSFLLNSLISYWRSEINKAKNKFTTEGIELFEVADKVDPTTMGLWLLKTDITLKDGSVVLFMDTEGFYGQDVSESYDARIFTVATLLSSHLIYTSKGLIDQHAIEYLEILARRTQVFQIENIIRTASDDDIHGIETVSDIVTHARQEEQKHVLQYNDFPPLSWVVKDFTQDLVNLTPNEWLEHYIEGHRDQKAKTRDTTLRDVFKRGIECHTLYLPSVKREELKDLGRIDMNDQLTREFIDDLKKMYESIVKTLTVKRIDKYILDGKSLVALTKFILQYVNEENYPKVPSLWDHWVDDLAHDSYQKIEKFYDERMRTALVDNPPLNSTELETRHLFTLTKAMEFYKSMLFNVKKIYEPGLEPLIRLLNSHFNQFQQEHLKRIERFMNDHVQRFKHTIDGNCAGIIIPQDPGVLLRKKDEAYKEWITKFSVQFSKYEESKIYGHEKKRLEEFIEERFNQVDSKNEAFIRSTLRSAIIHCSEKYTQSMNSIISDKPQRTTELEEASKVSSLECHREVDSFLDKKIEQENALEWIHSTKLYNEFVRELEETKKKNYLQAVMKNNELLRSMAKQKYTKLLAQAKLESQNIDPFPDEEQTIEKKLSNINQIHTNEYKNYLHSYNDISTIEEEYHTFQIQLLELAKETMDRNIEAVKLHSYNVFKCAKRKYHQEYKCFWCMSNFFTLAFDSTLTKIAERCFTMDKEGQKFSLPLRKKATGKWLEQDMSSEKNNVLFNMMMLLTTFLLVILGFVFLYYSINNKVSDSRVRRPRSYYRE